MRRLGTAVILLTALVSAMPAEIVKEMEVRDQPVADVLVALGKLYGTSILPDETVAGRVSYFFSEIDIETALEHFLPPLGLVYWRQGSFYRVSRLHIRHSSGGLDIDAHEVALPFFLDTLSTETATPILFDSADPRKLTLHGRGLSLREILDLLVLRFADLCLEEGEMGFLLTRLRPSDEDPERRNSARRAISSISRTKDRYTVHSPGEGFRDLLRALFSEDGKELVFLGKNDPHLPPIEFHNKSFDELLELLLDRDLSRPSRQ